MLWLRQIPGTAPIDINANLSVFTLLQQRSLSTHLQFEMHIYIYL